MCLDNCSASTEGPPFLYDGVSFSGLCAWDVVAPIRYGDPADIQLQHFLLIDTPREPVVRDIPIRRLLSLLLSQFSLPMEIDENCFTKLGVHVSVEIQLCVLDLSEVLDLGSC